MAIILASDKTHLTNFSGDKEFHAVYMSIGNIHKKVRNQVTRRAWLLLAQLPTPRFDSTSKSFLTKEEIEQMPGFFSRQLFHKCMGIVLKPLWTDTRQTVRTVCADGKVRECVGVLMAWIADLEEQWVIAGLPKYSCPMCKAGFTEFDHPHPQLPCTGTSILETLRAICASDHKLDLWQFIKHVHAEHLSGVEELCWIRLPVDLCCIICVDILHGLHKLFGDFPFHWLKNVVGEEELDRWFMAQPIQSGS